MSELSRFLDELFHSGQVVLDGRPAPTAADRKAAVPVLRTAFEDDALDLAGGPLRFDPAVAVSAALWTWNACWFLVSREEPPDVLERTLSPLPPPRTASQHLAADLTFRYLPVVHRRAHSLAPEDLLTLRTGAVLRDWPLSGVLADLHERPRGGLDFDGHPGLLMRYAERWARTERPTWCPPPESPAFPYCELVLGGRRLPGAAPTQTHT